MTKERATDYLKKLRSEGHGINYAICIANDDSVERWMRAETIVNQVANCSSESDIQFLIAKTAESINSLRNEPIHSRHARKADSPPSLGIWLLSSQIESSAGLPFLFNESNDFSFRENIAHSGYNPLIKRSAMADEDGIRSLLNNGFYTNEEAISKAYIEYIAKICSGPEKDSNFELIKEFTSYLTNTNSIKIFGKTVMEYLSEAGHEKTATLLLSELIDMQTSEIANTINTENIQEFAPTLNNSL